MNDRCLRLACYAVTRIETWWSWTLLRCRTSRLAAERQGVGLRVDRCRQEDDTRWGHLLAVCGRDLAAAVTIDDERRRRVVQSEGVTRDGETFFRYGDLDGEVVVERHGLLRVLVETDDLGDRPAFADEVTALVPHGCGGVLDLERHSGLGRNLLLGGFAGRLHVGILRLG